MSPHRAFSSTEAACRHPRTCRRILCATTLLFSTSSLHAQVNVEPLRARVKDDQLGAELDATFTGRTGNVRGLTLGASGLVGGRTGRHFAFIASSGDYSRFGLETVVARYFAHARYALTFAQWVDGEAFAQMEHDRFQRLTLRRLLGTGPRFSVVQEELVNVAFGTAYMLEFENLSATADDAAQDNTWHRASNFAGLDWTPDDRVTMSATTFFQPRFDDPGDFRLLGVHSLKFQVVPLLTASIGVTIRYDSRPPGSVRALDLEVKNAIGMRL